MNSKLNNLKKILTHLGCKKEAAEVGFLILASEVYVIPEDFAIKDIPKIYDNDIRYKEEVEKANPGLNWNALQIGQEIVLPDKDEFEKRMYPNQMMYPSENAYELIRRHEKLVLTAYDDGFGNMTIGYGHVIQPGDKFSSPTLTERQAEYILKNDAKLAAKAIDELVRVKLDQNQFDALISLIFNVGRGSFAESKLLTALNKSDFNTAAKEILTFTKVNGKVNEHLIGRRKAEAALFVS